MLAHSILHGCVSVSCPSLWSELIAMAHACLWSLFRWCSPSCGQMGRNPLSLRTLKQGSLASSAGPDFFPDSLLASCGTLAPFSLCSHSQPPSSPWDLILKAQASAPSPHPPQRMSRQTSQAGECWSALILCAEISPLWPLHPCCCALLCGSKASPPPTSKLRQ